VSQRVRRAGREWWSTAAEARAIELPGVRYAAYVGIPDPVLGERAALCLEGARDHHPPLAVADIRAALAPNPVDDIYDLARIPRDRRHGSKTDLEGLRALLARSRPRAELS